MSADDWLTCPVCHGLPENLREGYKQFYGKVDEVTYNKLKKEYKEKSESNTVRVDYEYSINSNKTIILEFLAECSNCRAKWEHTGVCK